MTEYVKTNDNKYEFVCPCGKNHELSVWAIAQLASRNELTYNCWASGKHIKVDLDSNKFNNLCNK